MRTESDNGFSQFFRMPHTSYGFAGTDEGPTCRVLRRRCCHGRLNIPWTDAIDTDPWLAWGRLMAGAELTPPGTLCTLVRYQVVCPASVCDASSKGQVVSDWIEIQKDPQHIAREKQKARALRQSQWWRNKIAQGICAYCQGTFASDALTMDHIVPLSRGGRSTKGNVVPCCAACNARKKYWTPAELLLQQLREQESK